MVGQPRRNSMKMASWSRVSEHLVNLIGMSDQLKWNNQEILKLNFSILFVFALLFFLFFNSTIYTFSKKVSGCPGSKTSLHVITVTRSSVSDRLMIL